MEPNMTANLQSNVFVHRESWNPAFKEQNSRRDTGTRDRNKKQNTKIKVIKTNVFKWEFLIASVCEIKSQFLNIIKLDINTWAKLHGLKKPTSLINYNSLFMHLCENMI